MTARRIAIGALLCWGLAQAAPARAEDPAVQTEPLNTKIFEDVVDGIGGILGVLVGPPISSPTPYLEGRVPDSPRKEGGEPVKTAAPIPVPVLPPAAAPPAVSPAAVAPPAPEPSAPPAIVPPPVVKSVTTPIPAPPPRPIAPVAAAPAVPAAPVAVVSPVPVCSVRVAATATLEQMRRLPRCE